MAKRKEPKEKDPGAVALAKKRAEKLSPKRRKEIAKKAIEARWERYRQAKKPSTKPPK